MTSVFFSPRAYCKIILHAAKYPHCGINGLLLGKQKIKDGRADLYVEDAIPLFHVCLHVSPMAEIALNLVNISGAFAPRDTLKFDPGQPRVTSSALQLVPNRCVTWP